MDGHAGAALVAVLVTAALVVFELVTVVANLQLERRCGSHGGRWWHTTPGGQ